MAGLSLLNSQCCSKDQISPSPNYQFPNPNSNPAHGAPRNREKTIADSESPITRSLVNGQVKLLKRGEELAGTTTDQPVPSSETAPALIHCDKISSFYSGSSAFIASPPPSSLPLPAFSMKNSAATSNAAATMDLLRILRLRLDES